ncbi:two-component sensor histidine kinase [Nocardia yunnanensis]|uniref:histidine kinase n=1 Tax=Nocardia yunnanensis TaxID=2382165 RepID=A0A386ZCX6_9NOCA|nr:histidine kinase [Nocardia yunnanensis]AYF74485.1 two-component sensor histidine kinase [Nocardia yunnanensis]
MSILDPSSSLSRLLRLVGLVAVVWSWNADLWHRPWVAALVALSWLGWAGWVVAPVGSRLERICVSAMAVGGGLTVAQSAGSVITAFAALFVAVSLLGEPIWSGWLVAAGTVLSMCVSMLIEGAPGRLPGLLAGAAVITLGGWSRRQARTAAQRNRLLVEQNRIIRVERDRAAALAERGRIARDIHDVLAHTLGGLVLQLDAADALLEARNVEQAAARVKASHALAVSGLADARRVVGALRSGHLDAAAELRRVIDEHRAAGGELAERVDTAVELADEQAAVALTRAVQEALTNARKHAPGQPVTLTLRDSGDALAATIANPLVAQRTLLSGTGSGAGLLGMRERIEAAGGTLTAGKEDGRWTVRILLPRK